ncbi:MAG TPA: hypothetical protein VGE19_07325 [Pseudoxanthomonas sp.]
MTAIEILRAASHSVPNEDYVQFMAAVDGIAELIEAAEWMSAYFHAESGVDRVIRLRNALFRVGGAK